MSGVLKKRGREDEGVMDSSKRLHEQQILHLLEGADEMYEEGECGASEEVVSGVMRSLEEEIGVTCSTSDKGSGLSRDDSVASDMTSGLGKSECGEIDLDYLRGASDDELGIPPPTPLSLKSEGRPHFYSEEGYCFDIFENPQLNSFGDNWHFMDDMADYKQFAVFEESLSELDLLVSEGTLVDGDYNLAAWRYESGCGLY